MSIKFDASRLTSRGGSVIFFLVFVSCFIASGGLLLFVLAAFAAFVVANAVAFALPSVNLPTNSAELFVLITGCSTGIGFYSAVQLAAAGYHIVATVRKEDDQRKLLEAAKNASVQDRVHVVLCDVRSSAALSSLLSNLTSLLKAKPQRYFIGLVNNATYLRLSTFELLTDEQVQDYIQTNIIGQLTLTRLALPLLRATAAANPALSPRILDISSGSTVFTTPGLSLYAASKSYMDTCSRILRLELEGVGSPVKLITLTLGAFNTSARKITAATQSEYAQKETAKKEQQKQIATTAAIGVLETDIQGRYEKLNEKLQDIYLNKISYDPDLNKPTDAIRRALTEKFPLNNYWVGNEVTAGPLLSLLPHSVIDFLIRQHFLK